MWSDSTRLTAHIINITHMINSFNVHALVSLSCTQLTQHGTHDSFTLSFNYHNSDGRGLILLHGSPPRLVACLGSQSFGAAYELPLSPGESPNARHRRSLDYEQQFLRTARWLPQCALLLPVLAQDSCGTFE